jgi:transcription antitermination factor NusG
VFKPLFVSYVFIYTTDEKYLAIKQTDGVINFLFWLAKPAIIKPEEIAAIKFYLNANYSLTVEKIPVNANDIVRITNEPIVPSPGNSLLFGEKTVKVHLPSLGYAILAAVNANTKVINAVDKFRYKAKGPFGIKWQEKFKVFG